MEDAAAAVQFVVSHADELRIHPDSIVLEGSSAGAITALTLDYERCNRLPRAAALPEGWKPAAVVSHSGAVYSHEGKLRWTDLTPPPTLFYHGTDDKIVTFNQIVIGKRGLYGTHHLEKKFRKNGFSFLAFHYLLLGHGVAMIGPYTDDILDMFLRHCVVKGEHIEQTALVRNASFTHRGFSDRQMLRSNAPKVDNN